MDRERTRHFSLIRDLRAADVVTLLNGFAGTGAVLSVLEYAGSGNRAYLWLAIVLLPVALVADFADGRIARRRAGATPLGQELDSLADLISFGVAPATLGFVLGLDGSVDVAILLYFVGCGIARLARFNATVAELATAPGGKVRHFEGTPIPTSLGLVAFLALLAWWGRTGDALPLGQWEAGPLVLHPVSLIFALSGSAMISKTLKVPKP
jgi:CDP-diacylglycerol--serine O-phosphatidyltransferase